jgi:hypothetical protein
MDGFSAFFAANLVDIVDFERTAIACSFSWQWMQDKVLQSMNSSSCGLSSLVGSRELMIAPVEVIFCGCKTRGLQDKVQDGRQHVNASRSMAQSTSGLWALSQSVPRMISWSPRAVT